MQTNSFIILKLISFFSVLNRYFENSLFYRFLLAVKTAIKGSRIINFVHSLFLARPKRDYYGGSLLLKILLVVFSFTAVVVKGVFNFFYRAYKTSIIKKIIDFFLNLKAINGSLPYKILSRLDILMAVFILGMLIVPNDFWNNMYIAIAAVFFGGYYALSWILKKQEGLKMRYVAPSLIIFVGFLIISLFTGYGDMDSVRVFVISFACISFAVLLPHIIKDKKTLDMFILMIFIGITISALFGLYQFAMGIEVRADFTDLTHSAGLARLFSTMANPNNDAKVWVMLIPYCVAYLLLSKNDLKKVILAGMLGICVLALVLTYSRSGYLAIVAGMAVFVILVAPRLVPIGIILAVIAIPFLPSSVTDRVLTIGQDTSSRYRMMIWEGTFRMNRDYWISGIGMGPSAFTRIYRVYSHPSAGNAMHTHNVFLNVLAEAGVGALLAFVAYFIRILKEGVSSVYKANSVNIKFFAAAGIASLTGFFMFAMVEYVWFYPRVMLTFFISMGLVHSIYRINREASQ